MKAGGGGGGGARGGGGAHRGELARRGVRGGGGLRRERGLVQQLQNLLSNCTES